jgi:formamidopyrimidine-DNA glycosylase
MPELPEVETTRRGLAPHCLGLRVERVEVRQRQLRWPVPQQVETLLPGQPVQSLERRAKYLLFGTPAGSLMVHLGMSGSLRVVSAADGAPATHDHIDLWLEGGKCLRYNDPRRFGSFHWLAPGESHPLLDHLGPEPLSGDFSGALLSLFLSGIRPDRAAGRISRDRYERLAENIKQVLTSAIGQGGTTLRDFVGGDGKPGYFAQQLRVYGRAGQPCRTCGTPLRERRLGQRSSVYCVTCQR